MKKNIRLLLIVLAAFLLWGVSYQSVAVERTETLSRQKHPRKKLSLSLPPIACIKHTYSCNNVVRLCNAFETLGWTQSLIETQQTMVQIRHIAQQTMVFAVDSADRVQCSQMVRSKRFLGTTFYPKENMHEMMGDVDFMPKTYLLSRPDHSQELYVELCKKQDANEGAWITKPYGGMQGKGIAMYADSNELRNRIFPGSGVDCKHTVQVFKRSLVQKYIHSPLLLYGRKFHIRTYVLVADDDPLLVFQCATRIRIGRQDYIQNSTESTVIATNFHPENETEPDVGHWTTKEFQSYLTNQKISSFTVEENLIPEIHRILTIVFRRFIGLKSPPSPLIHQFILLAADFILDSNFKLWLLEINSIPTVRCHQLPSVCDMVRTMMTELVTVLDEVYERNLKGLAFNDLDSVETFQYLLDAS